MKRRKQGVSLLNFGAFTATFVLGSGGAWAATQPPPPVNAKEVLEASPVLQQQPLAPKAEIAPVDVPAITKEAQLKQKSRVRFILTSAVVLGNTVLPEEAIKSIVSQYVGQSVGAAQLKAIAQKITERYHQNGYVTSRCFMPAQKVKRGRVVFQVEEDKLQDLAFQGLESFDFDKRFFMQFISDLKGKVVHLPTLEKRLQRLVRVPAQKIQPKLVKVDFGRSNLVLEITPRPDFYDVSFNNMGSRYTGRERLNLTTRRNNLAGRLDSLQASVQVAQNPRNFSLANVQYHYPIGSKAGVLSLSASRLDYQLNPKEVGYSAVRYEGGATSYQLQYTQPLLIEKQVNRWLNKLSPRETPLRFEAETMVGLEIKETTSDTIYNDFNSANFPAGYRTVQGKDKLVVPMIGVQFQHPDQLFSQTALNRYSLKLIHSWEGFLGSMTQEDIERKRQNVAHSVEPTTGPIGDVQDMKASFYKFYFTYFRTQPLPKGFQFNLSFFWDYTSAKKVPSDYKYTPAGGGVKGYTLNIGVSKKVMPGLILGGGLLSDNAISYHHGATIVCGESKTVNGEYTCSDNRAYLSAQYQKGGWHVNVQYFTDVKSYDPNGLNFRADLGYRW